MFGVPLADYVVMGEFDPRFAPSTAMWRGYAGRW